MQNRILTSTYSFEMGGEHAFNTYLSPLSHSGVTLGLTGSWIKQPADALREWEIEFAFKARLGLTQNPTRNADMDDICASFAFNIRKGFIPFAGLSLQAGPGALIEGGALYLPRNSNNPVAARAYIGATLNGRATYELRLWGKSFRLIDEVSLPTLGAFFSPHYGQSYYEIYLGDTSGLARLGWWGNHFAIDNLAAIEIPICSIRLRLGYRLNVLNSIASDIHSRITTHNFVVGISTDWINVTRRHE